MKLLDLDLKVVDSIGGLITVEFLRMVGCGQVNRVNDGRKFRVLRSS
jgi:hypothetical protein